MPDAGAPEDPDDVAGADGAPDGADPSGPASAVDGSTSPSIAGRVGGAARTVLGPFVATKPRIVLVVLVALIALVGAGFALGILGAPGVTDVQNSFGNVSANETVVETNVSVRNPNPVGVSLGGVTVDYTVHMNDVAMANGTKEGVAIDSGNSTLALETVLYNDRIPPWWISHVENRERTDVTVEATVSSSTLGRSTTVTRDREIQTDMLGQFASQEDRPINANSQLVDDPVLIVEETEAGWGTVTREETPLNMRFTVYNPNTEPYPITELRYEVSMNDVVVSRGATEDETVILGGSRETLTPTANIQNQHLDEWWVSHLNESVYGHQVSRFQIEFTAVVELPSGETVTVPLDQLTYAEWIATDLFEEGGDVGVPPQADPDPDDEGIIGNGSESGSDDGGDDGILGGDDGGSDDGSDDGIVDGGDDSDSDGNDSDGSDDGLVDGGDSDDGIVG